MCAVFTDSARNRKRRLMKNYHWHMCSTAIAVLGSLVMTLATHAESLRDVKSDTWVATDALGRALPGYEETGPPKDNRYVGIFYFLTHNQSGGDGPFDVTKIKAENPENPAWGRGAHFWGEPEYGYYQST